MKKILLLSVITFSFVFFNSCSKDKILNEQTNISTYNTSTYPLNEVKVQNNMLVFATRQLWDDALTDVNKYGDKHLVDLDKQFLFKSFLNTISANSRKSIKFDDDLFLALLNENGMIQIGEYVFKFNFETEKAIAVHINSISKLPKNEYDFIYNFTDNAMAELYPYAGESSEGDQRMPATCLGNDDVTSNVTGATPHFEAYQLKNNYQAAVVYRSLQVKIKSYTYGGFNVQVTGTGWWVKKSGGSATFSGGSGSSSHEENYRPYESTSCLSNFSCSAKYFEFADATNLWTISNVAN